MNIKEYNKDYNKMNNILNKVLKNYDDLLFDLGQILVEELREDSVNYNTINDLISNLNRSREFSDVITLENKVYMFIVKQRLGTNLLETNLFEDQYIYKNLLKKVNKEKIAELIILYKLRKCI